MTAHLEHLLTLSSLSAAFGHRVDEGRATDSAALFMENARLIFAPGSPRPGTLEGLAAIRGFLEARQSLTHVTTRHIATNFRLQLLSETEARLDSLLTVFRSDDASREPLVSTVCDVRELFTRTKAGEWLILERTTTPIFLRQP